MERRIKIEKVGGFTTTGLLKDYSKRDYGGNTKSPPPSVGGSGAGYVTTLEINREPPHTIWGDVIVLWGPTKAEWNRW